MRVGVDLGGSGSNLQVPMRGRVGSGLRLSTTLLGAPDGSERPGSGVTTQAPGSGINPDV
jgi:hypothetical protein